MSNSLTSRFAHWRIARRRSTTSCHANAGERSRPKKRFSATEKWSTRPTPRRSSGIWPTPASLSPRASAAVTSCSPSSTRPPVARRVPASTSTSSLWPLPSTPAIPRISPWRSSNEMPRSAGTPRSDVAVRFSTLKVAGPGRLLVHAEQDLAADHHGGDRLLVRLRCDQVTDHLASPHHRDPVRDLEHLAQLVADEDDRLAFLDQASQHHEELLGLLGRQHSGGLVEDEDFRPAV